AALSRRRPDVLQAARRRRPVPFGGAPEEGLVPEDGPADRAAVQPVVRVGEAGAVLGLAGLVAEVVEALPPDRARLVEAAAVIVVGARSRADVEHAAAGAPHLRVVG